MNPIRLKDGDAVCEIYPAIGGSLGRWSIGDQSMLRTAGAAAIGSKAILDMSSFPLVPYSNRIGQAKFDWNGRPVQLAANFAPEPHAIHGVGWTREWSVEAHTASTLTLALRHDGDADWPWPFTARQDIALSGKTLTIACNATNFATEAVPLAFGHHPYFDAERATLAFEADLVWLADSIGLPTTAVPPHGDFDFSCGRAVAGRNIDNCYVGVSGPATIAWEGRALALSIASTPQLPAAVVFIPQDGAAFCFEPVPHINNALNRPDERPGMPVIAPGVSFEATIHFEALSQ